MCESRGKDIVRRRAGYDDLASVRRVFPSPFRPRAIRGRLRRRDPRTFPGLKRRPSSVRCPGRRGSPPRGQTENVRPLGGNWGRKPAPVPSSMARASVLPASDPKLVRPQRSSKIHLSAPGPGRRHRLSAPLAGSRLARRGKGERRSPARRPSTAVFFPPPAEKWKLTGSRTRARVSSSSFV